MDIKSFLQQEKDRNADVRRRVKDFSVFDFGYIPSEPIMRDESKYLIKELIRFEISGIPTHLAVVVFTEIQSPLLCLWRRGMVSLLSGQWN